MKPTSVYDKASARSPNHAALLAKIPVRYLSLIKAALLNLYCLLQLGRA